MAVSKKEKERALRAVELFEAEYPDAVCSLRYENAFQLLIATRLSAQCTDKRVNMVTPALFKAFPNPKAFADAPLSEVEELIKTCGLYKTKAKDLVGIGKMITEEYGGSVPDSIEELIRLPGVGRKTANLVCGDIFGKPAVVTDTHFIRLCNRLGFVNTSDPYRVECLMREILPPDRSNDFCHRAVIHGREICTARKAECDKCCLQSVCGQKMKGDLNAKKNSSNT